MRVAIVDLGTNTCRLYLAEVGDEGALEPAARLTTVVRLGQGVDRSGRLHPEAVARTRACLREYAPRLEAYGPARRFLVATSVLRDAADGPAFLAAVERDFALPWRVLGGEEEGALAFRGSPPRLRAQSRYRRRAPDRALPPSRSAARRRGRGPRRPRGGGDL